MVKIQPFSALRYNKGKIKDLSKVMAPPYDVINKQQRKHYALNSRYNAVHFDLPKSKNRLSAHVESKRLIEKWLSQGILSYDKAPCIYIYSQKYKIGGATKTRTGFLSLLELQDERTVLPHEKIFKKFKLERFNLMKVTEAHLSPIFTFYPDEKNIISRLLTLAIKNKKADVDILLDGVNEKLWCVSDETFINKLKNLMKQKKAFIADGHHRFEASMFLREHFNKARKKGGKKMPFDYTFAYFMSMQDKGLTILPTHRTIKYLPKGFSRDFLIEKLSQYFYVKEIKNKQDLASQLSRQDKAGKHAFGFFFKGTFLIAVLKSTKGLNADLENLDVSILHSFILPELLGIKEKIGSKRNIYYYRGKTESVKRVKSGEFKMAIFLNPTKVEEVKQIAQRGGKMPHKSTYFYPKLLTGLVIHKW